MYLYNEFILSCPSKQNSNTIELRVHKFCYWGLRLTLCYSMYMFPIPCQDSNLGPSTLIDLELTLQTAQLRLPKLIKLCSDFCKYLFFRSSSKIVYFGAIINAFGAGERWRVGSYGSSLRPPASTVHHHLPGSGYGSGHHHHHLPGSGHHYHHHYHIHNLPSLAIRPFVVYFDQRTHACACVRMVEND